MVEIPQKFLEALAKDPQLISKLAKRDELEGFQERHNVNKNSPLKCPACRSMYGGTLWYNTNESTTSSSIRFACRKCELEFSIHCVTIPTSELFKKLRLLNKEDEAAFEWFDSIRSQYAAESAKNKEE